MGQTQTLPVNKIYRVLHFFDFKSLTTVNCLLCYALFHLIIYASLLHLIHMAEAET